MPMIIEMGCIVEGEGDALAVPIVLRRIVSEINPSIALRINEVMKIDRGKIVQENVVERYVELLARRLSGSRAIVLIMDSDDDCPAILGPRLLARAAATRMDIP